jgi:hypothetical protein
VFGGLGEQRISATVLIAPFRFPQPPRDVGLLVSICGAPPLSIASGSTPADPERC